MHFFHLVCVALSRLTRISPKAIEEQEREIDRIEYYTSYITLCPCLIVRLINRKSSTPSLVGLVISWLVSHSRTPVAVAVSAFGSYQEGGSIQQVNWVRK
jgi:hypothetical protein